MFVFGRTRGFRLHVYGYSYFPIEVDDCSYPLVMLFNTVAIIARIASGLVMGQSCLVIHESKADKSSGWRRTCICTPLPVAGGPRFFFGTMV
jgi:hypothetical protein